MLNILMATGHFAPRLGGVEKHVLRVSEELARRGHAVTVLTRRWEAAWPQEEDLRGIRVRRVAGGIASAVRDRRVALLRQADVIHCHDLYAYLRFVVPAWPGPQAAHRSRAALFVTFHGYEGYPVPRAARWLRRRLAARAAGTICMGGFICRWYGHPCDLVSYGGVDGPPEVTGGGVRSCAPTGDAPAGGAPPALYVGRLAPDTGIMAYLEALRLLAVRRQRHEVALSICGDGPLRDAVIASARAAGIQVELHGWQADVAPFLERSRFAFVSGYLSILEAMAHHRLACALYDNPLKRDYLESFPAAPHMVIAGDPESLAAALARHLDEPAMTAAKVEAAAAYARAQTWERLALLYLDLYRSRGLGA